MLDVKVLLAKILQSLKSPIIYKEYTQNGTITLAAHGATSAFINIPQVSGYKMLSVPHVQTNGNVWLAYSVTNVNGSASGSVGVWFRNTSTGSASISSFTVGILFIRSDLY